MGQYPKEYSNMTTSNLRRLNVTDIYNIPPKKYLISNIMLPSQYPAYSICVEVMKDWFLSKFKDDFFNSIYVDGRHSFYEFRKFSEMNDQIGRANPVAAIFPVINQENNRDWIDSSPEMPMMMRRSRMEGVFFSDLDKRTHLQIMFKTITMNFVFKVRVDTRAQQLDLYEFIKIKHRAGFSESKTLSLDIHVPKQIIMQIAYDAGYEIKNEKIVDAMGLLNYLNSHSYLPFLYKMRYDNGNNEFFVKVPNCMLHLKTEMPSRDDGERKGSLTDNYTIDFSAEVEMTAPYMYGYYSQTPQSYMLGDNIITDTSFVVMQSVMTIVPERDENKWKLYTKTEYLVDEEDLDHPIEIDFSELFDGSDMEKIINYTKDIAVNPYVFINFKIFNDAVEQPYEMDWSTLKCKILKRVENVEFVIGIYCDMSYINETMINLEKMYSGRV